MNLIAYESLVMACFKLPTLATRPQEKITIVGVRQFKWEGNCELEEIDHGLFGTAYKGKFNTETVVVKRLKGERLSDVGVYIKEGRLIQSLAHHNIVAIKGCYLHIPSTLGCSVCKKKSLICLNFLRSWILSVLAKKAQDKSSALAYVHGPNDRLQFYNSFTSPLFIHLYSSEKKKNK